MDLNYTLSSKDQRNLGLVIKKDLPSCTVSSHSVRWQKMKPEKWVLQESPAHFSGNIPTWGNWATEKSNLKHHMEIRCYFTEQNTDAQRAGGTRPRSHSVWGHIRDLCSTEALTGCNKGYRSSQFQLCKKTKNTQPCPLCSPTFRPPQPACAGAIFSCGIFFQFCV